MCGLGALRTLRAGRLHTRDSLGRVSFSELFESEGGGLEDLAGRSTLSRSNSLVHSLSVSQLSLL